VWDHVSQDAKVYADEHGSYNDLIDLNRMARVNHPKACSSEHGTNTNTIESFFSRIQRANGGVHHRFSTRDWYLADIAWKEATLRMSNGALTRSMLAQALRRLTSL
jgi:transposase-like protein